MSTGLEETPRRQRRRLRWSLLLGTPLLLGVGALALGEYGLFEGTSSVRDRPTEGTPAGPVALPPPPADLPSTQGSLDPPGPPGAEALGSPDVLPIAPSAPVGANRFPAVPAPLTPKPAAVRGIYLNARVAGSSRRLRELIALAEETEINAFVIDVKEAGEVSYHSGVAVARAAGANRGYITDPRGMLAEPRRAGIYPIARIVVFKDPILAEWRPGWAIQNRDGSLWQDRQGSFWVDPYNREVWDYNIALAREAVLLGFSEIQWDYVRFPDVPARYLQHAIFPARAGRSRTDAIREFLQYSREELADLNVPITADVFGLTVSVRNDMGIGQEWERLIDATDVILPMVYPSHFARGSYGIPNPNASPYETVKTALDYAVRRSAGVSGAASIRPWLQDFSLGEPTYGAAEVRAQIQATYDAGLTEWILWNPGSRYTAAALAAPDGTLPPGLRSEHRARRDTTSPPPLLGVPVQH